VIRLAGGAYDGGDALPHPAALADTLFATPLVYRGGACAAGFAGIEGAPTLVAAWAMPRGRNEWVLRLHEVGGQCGTARLALAAGWTAERCSLDGAKSLGRVRGGALAFRGYEIVSVRVWRTGAAAGAR
jgi:alpha-mannosidase